MTTITRFTKEQLIARADHLLCVGKAFIAEHPEYDGMAKDVELFNIALASLEAEQRRNPVLAYADSYRDMAKQGVESIPIWSVITDLERNIAPLYAAPPAPVVPATLPCAVELKPGFIIGKGCKTATLLTALQRRADYYAKLEVMTPEERADHDAGIEEFKAMLPQPAPVVPDEMTPQQASRSYGGEVRGYRDGWNACRAAMLQGSQPVSNRDELPVSEIECDICGFKSTDPDGAHYCCEDNSND